jgi:hypothetical protein
MEVTLLMQCTEDITNNRAFVVRDNLVQQIEQNISTILGSGVTP